MLKVIRPSIIFHIINDKNWRTKFFGVELEFLVKKKINLDEQLIIDEKNFPKSKDKFKTKIILNIDNKSYKFIITLYYDENHITIFKSFKVGVAYEIMHFFPNQNITPLDRIDFISEDKQEISTVNFDTIILSFIILFL